MYEEARERVLDALEKEAASHGIDVVDVEVVGGSGAPVVRVRLDYAEEEGRTITLDDVSAQSEWVDAVVDAVDPVPSSYTLEVSSPGLDRPLRRPRDFERFSGSTVTLVTTATEGRKRFTGTLVGIEGDVVRMEADGQEHEFGLGEIRSCKLKPKFD